jgi:tRNA-Thr(GGU) m(6)t(6)A37 methyltransferase TsaA
MSAPSLFHISAIGHISSTLKKLEDCPRQESENAPPATIHIYSKFNEAVADIKVGDQLILLTWLSRSDRTVLTTHPRNNPANALTGVFSTRSPDRPNPIGLHNVTVTAINKDRSFEVEALEVLDGTPIVDIKSV